MSRRSCAGCGSDLLISSRLKTIRAYVFERNATICTSYYCADTCYYKQNPYVARPRRCIPIVSPPTSPLSPVDIVVSACRSAVALQSPLLPKHKMDLLNER